MKIENKVRDHIIDSWYFYSGFGGVRPSRGAASNGNAVSSGSSFRFNASPSAALPPVNFNVSNQTGVWVNGQGTVMVAPNIANLNLGVTAQASKVADAQAQAACGDV